MSEALNDLAAYLKEKLGDDIEKAVVAYGELTVTVAPDDIIDVLNFLKRDVQCQFISIIDICGADYPSRQRRFDVVYHLLSPRQNLRIRVKVEDRRGDAGAVRDRRSSRAPTGSSARPTTSTASCSPAIRTCAVILTDYGFEGHPLRKDFPLTGFVEVRYDDAVKRVVYEPVELKQEFRNFDFLSPWEGPDYVLPGDEKAKPN
jgi:NADH-quinone oxidoreductase subunit C